MSDGGAYVPSREIYDLVLEVRDEVRNLKTAYWLRVEEDTKDDARRDEEIRGLRSKYYAVFGVIGGLTAGVVGMVFNR